MTRQLASESILNTTRAGAVAEVHVGNGTRRNALPGEAWTQLADHIEELGQDPSVRVLVIRGRGDTFCAGSDINDWADTDDGYVEDSFARMEAAFTQIERCPQPVVAAIHGTAAGAGCQLAMACDIRLMADTASIGMPIARLGILASPAFAARLVTAVGPEVARELLYTGRLIDAHAAVRLGLANHSTPAAELHARAFALASRIAQQPAAAIRAAKLAVSAALAPQREASVHNPRPAMVQPHFQHAVTAFLEVSMPERTVHRHGD